MSIQVVRYGLFVFILISLALIVLGVVVLVFRSSIGDTIIRAGEEWASYSIDLTIDPGEWSKEYYLGYLKIPEDGMIRFRAVAEKEAIWFPFVLNGELIIESITSNKSYQVPMPCILSVNEQCYRILMLIPGYDAPMDIDKGEYSVYFKASWKARSSSIMNLKILAYYYAELEQGVSVDIVGVKPTDTSRWFIAAGSTRSFSFLVNTTSTINGRVEAWAWLFDPGNTSSGVFRLRILERATGEEVASIPLKAQRDNNYWSLYMVIKLPPGRYKIVCSVNGLETSVDVVNREA